MKKLVTGILAMLLCFGCLAGCGDTTDDSSSTPNTNSSTPDASTPDASTPDEGEPLHQHEIDLKDVKDYLYEQLVKKNYETRENFTLPNSFTFVGSEDKYDVAWSVDVESGVTIQEGETEDTVVIAALDADLPFVLTATISDPEGCHTVNFSLDGLAKAMPQIVPLAITEKPTENTAYKLYVYQSTKAMDCYFMGEMNGYYFKTSENYEEGVDLYVEYIANSDNFNVYFNDANNVKQYIGVQLSSDGAHDNIVFATAPVSSFFWSAELGTICTHLDVNKNGEASDYYLGNYSSHVTFSASMISYAGGAGNNVGGLVTMVDKNSIVIPDSKKVADVAKDLDVQLQHTLDKTVSLTTSDDRYPEVSITWTVEEGKGATVTENGLELVIPAEKATAVLTATVSCGEVTETKEFTLELGPKTVAPDKTNAEAIVNAAFNLAAGEVLPGESYTLTGEITRIKTAYSADYGNVTVIISVNDKEIECYRMKGEGADVIAVGDTITVTGVLKNYNGTVEFDQGCTLDSYTVGEGSPDEPEVKVPAADSVLTIKEALTYGATFEHNTYSTDKYYVEATIKNVYNTQYGNMYLVDDEGNEICVYGTYNADGTVRYDALETKPVAGDTVKIYGIIGTYNSNVQFKNAWIVAHTAATETPDEPEVKVPAADSVLTIKEALAYGATFEHNTYSTDKYYVEATIKNVYNTQYGNMYLVDDEGNEICVYGTYNADGTVRYDALETKPVAGDTVKIYGIIGTYNSNVQFKNAWIVAHTAATPDEGGESEGDSTTPTYTAVATFTFGNNGDATHTDGTAIATTDFTNGNYTLSLKDCVKVYEGAYDAKGNSCIKLGASKAAASFSFTVADDVDYVIIKVAQYKTYATKVTINGTEYTIETASNNGEYTEIVIDTTTVKTISVATVQGSHRAMIDAIIFGVKA